MKVWCILLNAGVVVAVLNELKESMQTGKQKTEAHGTKAIPMTEQPIYMNASELPMGLDISKCPQTKYQNVINPVLSLTLM